MRLRREATARLHPVSRRGRRGPSAIRTRTETVERVSPRTWIIRLPQVSGKSHRDVIESFALERLRPDVIALQRVASNLAVSRNEQAFLFDDNRRSCFVLHRQIDVLEHLAGLVVDETKPPRSRRNDDARAHRKLDDRARIIGDDFPRDASVVRTDAEDLSSEGDEKKRTIFCGGLSIHEPDRTTGSSRQRARRRNHA
jgi:hypothetical protein